LLPMTDDQVKSILAKPHLQELLKLESTLKSSS
jgi:hypothetical protein